MRTEREQAERAVAGGHCREGPVKVELAKRTRTTLAGASHRDQGSPALTPQNPGWNRLGRQTPTAGATKGGPTVFTYSLANQRALATFKGLFTPHKVLPEALDATICSSVIF